MTPPPDVTIRRSFVEVELRGDARDGNAVQQWLTREVEHVIATAMEAALAGLDDAGQVLVLDRLEVDVSPTCLDDLSDELGLAISRQARVWLRDAERSSGSVPSSRPGSSGTRGADIARRSPAQSRDEVLATFLQSGRVPWWAGAEVTEDLDATMRASLDEHASSAVRPSWVPALKDAVTRRRLVLQFSEATVRRVVRLLASAVADALDEVLCLESTHGGVYSVRRALDTRAIDLAAREAGLDSSVTPAAAGESGVPVRSSPLATDLAAAARAADPRVARVAPHPAPGPGDGVAAEPGQSTGDEPRLDVGATAPRSSGDGEESGILVEHAGLVLLHPFLPRLLAAVSLLTDVESAGPTDRGRAVGLLHHLATGEHQVAEHTSTVAKVLCGMELHEPVPRDPRLASAAYDEADALLHAVIGHWEALKGTSPAALRGEFLCRPGLLSVDLDGGWLLRVEERTADILLDGLPWGIGMIRLPWMRRMLRVDWRT